MIFVIIQKLEDIMHTSGKFDPDLLDEIFEEAKAEPTLSQDETVETDRSATGPTGTTGRS